MKKHKINPDVRPEIILVILFFACFVIGMIISFMVHGESPDERYQWLNTSLMYLRYGEINYGDVLFYVLKKRCSIIFLLFLICMTGKGRLFLPVGGAIAGAFCGFYVTEFVCCKGILGSGLFIMTLFPHYICYAYGYYALVALFSRSTVARKNINRSGQYKERPVTGNRIDFIKKYVPIAVVIIGIVLECYVNPFFLKIFLKFFM